MARYLRDARGYSGIPPATLSSLPSSRPHHYPAMIAAFGVASEIEPGIVDIDADQIRGVHLTLLKPDGSAKAGTERDKLMVGPSSGWPIVVAPVGDLLGLAITEGLEDALSVHQATGLGVWVAGSAGRMPALASRVPPYLETVTIFAHADDAGRKFAPRLADALLDRGIEVFTEGLG